MPLTTSGQIDLNAMHVEAGGTTGTECTLNDADIRGMISKASGAQMGFNEWYGASSVDRTSRSLAINSSHASGFNMSDYMYTLYRGANNFSQTVRPNVRMHTSANGLFSLITSYCFHPASNYNTNTQVNELDHNTRAGIGLIVSQHNSDTSTGTVTSTTSKLLQPSNTGTTSNAWRANGFVRQVAAITNEGDVYVAFYTVEGFSSSQTNEESWHVIKLDKDLSIQWAKKWEWSSGVGLDGQGNNTGSWWIWGDNPTTEVAGIGKAAEGAFIFDDDNWFLGVQDVCQLENSSGVNASTEARNFIIKGSKSTGARQASVARYVSASNMPGSGSTSNGSFAYAGFYGSTQFKFSLSPNSSSTFYMYSGPALRMDTMKLSDLSSTGYQHTKFKTFNDGTYENSNIRRAFVALDGRFVVQHYSSVTEGKSTTYTEYISIYSTSGNLDTFKILDSTDSSRFVDILGPWGDASSTDGFAVLQFYSDFGNNQQTDMFDRLTTTKLGIPYIAYDNTASTLTTSNHLSVFSFIYNANDFLEIHPEDHEMYTIGVAPKFANEQSSSPQYPTWSAIRYRSMLSLKRSDIVYNTTRQSFATIKPAVASADTSTSTGTPTYGTPTATLTDRTSSVGALSSWTPDVDGANVSSLWTTNTWLNNKFAPVASVYSKRFSA